MSLMQMHVREASAARDSQLLIGVINGIIIATRYIQLRESKPWLKHRIHGYLGFM